MRVEAIVALSGGMDSLTVLATAIEGGAKCSAIGFCYGSKHNKYENAAAEQIAKHYEVPYQLVDLTQLMSNIQSDLLLSGGKIPEGHYEAESMKRTVVPGRNIIFSAILAGIAMSRNCKEIWLGVHAGDHHIYPDCRPGFVNHMRAAIANGTESVVLKTPFLYFTKAEILSFGFEKLSEPPPYHLSRTCYKDQELACGKCGSCQERLEAFEKVKRVDPLNYESRELLPR